MTDFAILLETFFYKYLSVERGCSTNTVANYKDTFVSLFSFLKTGLLERYEVSEDREVYFRTTHTGKSVKYGWVVIVPSGISENLILRIFSMSGFVSSLRRASSSLFRIS